MTAHERSDIGRQVWIAAGLSLFAALAFFFSTNAKLRDLDYTNQIASALLRGHLGLTEKPPEWLNEMIPHGNRYYSAFPLGAVLSMVPVALLQKAGLIHNFPGHLLATLIAGCCVYFFFQLAKALAKESHTRDSFEGVSTTSTKQTCHSHNCTENKPAGTPRKREIYFAEVVGIEKGIIIGVAIRR